jgi:AbrB family looped-hinge helix DNA binding protein
MKLERTINEKGQIVIPKDIRVKMGLKSGTEVELNMENGKIIIEVKNKPEEIVNDFANVPKKIPNLNSRSIKDILDEEYDLHRF